MKTKYGMTRRPHFEIIGWKTPGEDSAGPDTAELEGQAGQAAAQGSRCAPLPRVIVS
jgi:hypothetical protein